jgi:hypothetical protein
VLRSIVALALGGIAAASLATRLNADPTRNAPPRAARHLDYPEPLVVGPYRQKISAVFTDADGLPQGRIDRIVVTLDAVVAGGPQGAARWGGHGWSAVTAGPNVPLPQPVRAGPFAGTDQGLSLRVGGRLIPVNGWATPLGEPSPHLQALALDGTGRLWIGTDRGAVTIRSAATLSRLVPWFSLAPAGLSLPRGAASRVIGLPVLDVRSLAIGRDGAVWLGTARGVARLHRGAWQYYAGRRWLPHDRVNAVATDPAGGAWVATEGGVAHLTFQPMTLARKAAHYEAITAARHNRRGYVTRADLTRPGDLSTAVHEASDNDGLWTSLYLAAECFRYAATGDGRARALACRSLRAMLDLVRLTGFPGFPARATVFRGERVTGRDPNDPNWQYVSPVDPNSFWKGDTSSDEIDGHYLAWCLYHDLVADASEKRELAATCRAVTNHIIDHGYLLVGPSGQHTTWGVWAPALLNDDPQWVEERGLNALEILSHLKVAIHLCGDRKFQEAYDTLIERHHYAGNTLNQKVLPPAGEDNHSDDELAAVAYYPLLVLERDPGRRTLYLSSLERTQRILRRQGSPFHNVIYGALTHRSCDAATVAAYLRDTPWDLCEWTMTNRHRADVRCDTSGNTSRVLPPSERAVEYWNSNPYRPDGGSDGRGELDGAFFLLPYWMARYHGILVERK